MAKIGVKLGIDGEAEYRKSLNNIIQSAKTLDKQMEELQSSFDENTDSMEKNAKETELLQKKAELLNQEVEKMQTMVDAAAEKFGENSTECQKWEQSLAQAQTELNKTNSEIQAHQDAADEANTALGQLTAEIESQTAELDSLRDQYINAVLEFGDTSDEAENLASQISSLSDELNANQSALDNANASADALTGSLEETSGAAGGIGSSMMDAAGQFIPGMDLIKSAAAGAGIADIFSGIISVAMDLGQQIWDLAIEWEESMGDMAVATGLTGDELTTLHKKAEEMYLGFNSASMGMSDFSAITSMLYTRLGMGEEQCESFVNAIAQYSDVFGVDGVQATNDVVDIMKQYGLVTGDATKDTETAIQIFESLSQAQADADVSTSELAKKLTQQASAFQSLGMDYQEAIGFMDAYRDAGGEVSDVTTAMRNMVKNLAGETDDLGGAWDEIVNKLSTSTDPFETLNETIAGTDKTLQDVLGKNAAQRLITTFSNGGVDVDRFTDSIKNSQGTLDDFFSQTRTTEDNINSALKGMVSSGMSFDTSFAGIFNNIKASLDMMDKSSSTSTKNTTNSLKNMSSDTTKDANNMKTSLSSSFSSIATDAGSMVSSVVGDMWSLQDTFDATDLRLHIEAPTFTYTKGGTTKNPTYTPSVSYRTYAAAYDKAIRLTAPTIFGAMNGDLLVGGDRPGAEIVVGEDHLLDMFEAAMNRSDGGIGSTSIYITNNIDGAEDPEVYAARLCNQIKLEMRMA